jgi:hypothetical protein
MQFIKDILRNLVILMVIGVGLYILFPKMMGDVIRLYEALFGLLAILLLIVAALPQRKRGRR